MIAITFQSKWEAERVAAILEAERLTEFTGYGEAWAKDCAGRIRAQVERKRERRSV